VPWPNRPLPQGRPRSRAAANERGGRGQGVVDGHPDPRHSMTVSICPCRHESRSRVRRVVSVGKHCHGEIVSTGWSNVGHQLSFSVRPVPAPEARPIARGGAVQTVAGGGHGFGQVVHRRTAVRWHQRQPVRRLGQPVGGLSGRISRPTPSGQQISPTRTGRR